MLTMDFALLKIIYSYIYIWKSLYWIKRSREFYKVIYAFQARIIMYMSTFVICKLITSLKYQIKLNMHFLQLEALFRRFLLNDPGLFSRSKRRNEAYFCQVYNIIYVYSLCKFPAATAAIHLRAIRPHVKA